MYIYSLLPSTVSDLGGTVARKTQSPGYESAPARGSKSLEETEQVQVAVPTSAVSAVAAGHDRVPSTPALSIAGRSSGVVQGPSPERHIGVPFEGPESVEAPGERSHKRHGREGGVLQQSNVEDTLQPGQDKRSSDQGLPSTRRPVQRGGCH